MARFKKGCGAGPGRPKGSTDKEYLRISYWYDELMKDWGKLRPAQRAKIATQLIQSLSNKVKNLPENSEESVRNAEETMKMLEDMEKTKQKIEDGVGLSPIPPALDPQRCNDLSL